MKSTYRSTTVFAIMFLAVLSGAMLAAAETAQEKQALAKALAGVSATLQSGVASSLRIAEGTHTVRALVDGVAPQSFEIEGEFLTRLFDTDAVVVNPDHAAVIVRETTTYRAHQSGSDDDGGAPWSASVPGELMFRDHANFEFEPIMKPIEPFRDQLTVVSNLAGPPDGG